MKDFYKKRLHEYSQYNTGEFIENRSHPIANNIWTTKHLGSHEGHPSETTVSSRTDRAPTRPNGTLGSLVTTYMINRRHGPTTDKQSYAFEDPRVIVSHYGHAPAEGTQSLKFKGVDDDVDPKIRDSAMFDILNHNRTLHPESQDVTPLSAGRLLPQERGGGSLTVGTAREYHSLSDMDEGDYILKEVTTGTGRPIDIEQGERLGNLKDSLKRKLEMQRSSGIEDNATYKDAPHAFRRQDSTRDKLARILQLISAKGGNEKATKASNDNRKNRNAYRNYYTLPRFIREVADGEAPRIPPIHSKTIRWIAQYSSTPKNDLDGHPSLNPKFVRLEADLPKGEVARAVADRIAKRKVRLNRIITDRNNAEARGPRQPFAGLTMTPREAELAIETARRIKEKAAAIKLKISAARRRRRTEN